MVDVERLEDVAEPGQLGESAVAHGPVGQQSREGGEDVERLSACGGVGGEEGGYHDVGGVGIDAAVLGVEGLSAKG